MKILIVGAGGIGGYFGAKLIQAGADITYLLRPKRHAHIQANGLAIESPRGWYVPTISRNAPERARRLSAATTR